MVSQGFIGHAHLFAGDGGADDSSDSTDYDDTVLERTRFLNLVANSELRTFSSGGYDGSTLQPDFAIHDRDIAFPNHVVEIDGSQDYERNEFGTALLDRVNMLLLGTAGHT